VVFLTNNMQFAASTIAAIYKDRWAVELFFKAIKQNLKIKTFLGTSANAVKTQIWIALIAILIALLRHQLFVYRDLFTWLDNPFEGPPALAKIDSKQLAFELTR
jgi:IS4 transposase